MKNISESYRDWGRERLIFLQLGYMFLTMRSREVSEVTKSMIEDMDLKEKIGPISLKMAALDDRPGLMIAERIYSYIMAQDEIAFQEAAAARDVNAIVFKDPLVFSRYASSLFLQDRFGQAKSVLDQILYTPEWEYMISSNEIAKFDVSQYEIYMRHSQYTLFRSYQEEDKMVENIRYITRDFEKILADIHIHMDVFNEKHFRAVAWCYLVTRYFYCLESIIPSFYRLSEPIFLDYLKRHFDIGFSGAFKTKPELLCVSCLLQKDNPADFSQCANEAIAFIKADERYPRSARLAFIDVLTRIEEAYEKDASIRPKVFFSYSHLDKKIADRIISFLVDADVDIISDKQFITGESLLSGMEQAIMKAEVAIIFVSSQYLESEGWLQKERETIFARNVKGEISIVVLTYDVTVDQVRLKFPMLANTLMLSIDDSRIEHKIFRLSEDIYGLWEKQKAASANRKSR